MATLILSAAGSAFGGPLGAGVGRVVGGLFDAAAIGALQPARQVGQRLTGLTLSSAADGAPMPLAYGRARVSGQVIWAAHFREKKVEQQTGGGKGGPKVYSYSYSLSFAVALCEGPIDGVGRVWADGQPMDLSGVVMRVHTGGAGEAPDPLIEAIEGSAPAFRGTAYLVFEDLVLDPWGARPPQIAAEVFRRPGSGGLEGKLKSVCLIPGAGEFVLSDGTKNDSANLGDRVFRESRAAGSLNRADSNRRHRHPRLLQPLGVYGGRLGPTSAPCMSDIIRNVVRRHDRLSRKDAITSPDSKR